MYLDAIAQVSRAAMEEDSHRLPPEHLGEKQAAVPEHPLTRRRKGVTPPKAPLDPTRLTGDAGSPGVVVAPVRVVDQLSRATELRRGEVLVTSTTSSDWVPRYRLATAVVTDVGGALSHGAIVARELGIPAVVATRDATQRLKTGMVAEVDGFRGVVRIVQRHAEETPPPQ